MSYYNEEHQKKDIEHMIKQQRAKNEVKQAKRKDFSDYDRKLAKFLKDEKS